MASQNIKEFNQHQHDTDLTVNIINDIGLGIQNLQSNGEKLDEIQDEIPEAARGVVGKSCVTS